MYPGEFIQSGKRCTGCVEADHKKRHSHDVKKGLRNQASLMPTTEGGHEVYHKLFKPRSSWQMDINGSGLLPVTHFQSRALPLLAARLPVKTKKSSIEDNLSTLEHSFLIGILPRVLEIRIKNELALLEIARNRCTQVRTTTPNQTGK